MKNTTGIPKPTDYLLGRGELYFSLLDPTSMLPSGGFEHLGNAPAFTITVSSDVLTHTSSLTGLATIDAQVTTAQNANLTFQLEEFNDGNLSKFFSGATASFTNGSVAGFASYAMIPAGLVAAGRWYNVRSNAGVRNYDIKSASIAVISGGTTWVENTDYILDNAVGRIFLISTSTRVQAAVTGNVAVMVAYTADSAAKNVDEVRTLTQSTITGALQFISIDARASTARKEYMFHNVSLQADGDMALIGTDWSKMPFKGAAQSNTLASPTSPTCTIRQIVP